MRKTVRQAARATVQLAGAGALGFFSYLFITVVLVAATGTLLLVGAGLLPETVLLVRRLAGAKRRQAERWTGREIPEAYLPLTGPLWKRLRTAVSDPGTHTDLRWMVAYYAYGSLALLAVPLWVVGLLVDGVWCGLLRREAVVLPLISRVADLDAVWSSALLKPSPKVRVAESQFAGRVKELIATRAGAIAAHDAELRRIEGDLRDSTQARLVSLSMRIGLAQRAQDRDPETARKLLADAQDQAQEALAELRHVVRGFRPPILTDRGLARAVRALAASSELDVTVKVEGMEDGAHGGARTPAPVEAAAYFVVAEALTNAARYNGSNRAKVVLTRSFTGLRVVVRHEGPDGANEVGDAGLVGKGRRGAALDGAVLVTSSPGSPTVIDVELPCVW